MNSLWYKLLSMCIPFLPQYPKTLEALRLPCAPNICSIVCIMTPVCVFFIPVFVCFLSQMLFKIINSGDEIKYIYKYFTPAVHFRQIFRGDCSAIALLFDCFAFLHHLYLFISIYAPLWCNFFIYVNRCEPIANYFSTKSSPQTLVIALLFDLLLCFYCL